MSNTSSWRQEYRNRLRLRQAKKSVRGKAKRDRQSKKIKQR